jgi:hypothetical protein
VKGQTTFGACATLLKSTQHRRALRRKDRRFFRTGSSGEIWQRRLEKLKNGRWFGRFFGCFAVTDSFFCFSRDASR